MLIPAENPRGAPAFRDLAVDPPATEAEFIGLWKLYFLTLLAESFEQLGFSGPDVDHLRAVLAREKLIKGKQSLASWVQTVFNYVKGAMRPASVEGGVNIDPITQMPVGFTGRISFREPSPEAKDRGLESVDELFARGENALSNGGREYSVWILLDRLDVAFVENPELEQNALRALFRVYLDLQGYTRLRLKIFLRTDIWNRITRQGFREASHITRHVTITWNRTSLLNLIVRRALHNASIEEHYGVKFTDVAASISDQETFLGRLFPSQVDVGPNKPTTLDWLLSRTRDGTQTNAPRELIHLLNSLRSQQMRRYELGEPEPDGEALFARATFKNALPEVSEVRLNQTLYAEHPDLRDAIESLRQARTLQKVETLAGLWGKSPDETRALAESLVEVGFFERRGTPQAPDYWVPFLYRDALAMVQGTAEAD